VAAESANYGSILLSFGDMTRERTTKDGPTTTTSLRKRRAVSLQQQIKLLPRVRSGHPDVLYRRLCVYSLQRQSVEAFAKLSIMLY